MIKKLVVVLGCLFIVVVLIITGVLSYPYLFPLKAESGDLIVFETKVNGPERSTEAYIFRDEAPNTQLVGQMIIPAELSNGEMVGKFYQSAAQTLYFSNEYGFYKYDMNAGTVVTIQEGQAGFTFKNIDGVIWYNLDAMPERSGPNDAISFGNLLCEYTIATEKNECHMVDNMQIFDAYVDEAGIYLGGISIDNENNNAIINTFVVLDNQFHLQQRFVAKDNEQSWSATVFYDKQEANKIIAEIGGGYYSYNKQTAAFEREQDTQYPTVLSSGSASYTIFGGNEPDYDKEQNCTHIALANQVAQLPCKAGQLLVTAPCSNCGVLPYDNGLLVKANMIVTDGVIEENVNVIDLPTLTEIKRFNPEIMNKHAIYIE